MSCVAVVLHDGCTSLDGAAQLILGAASGLGEVQSGST